MLSIYDRELKKLAILGNAKDITEAEILNGVAELKFSLPYDDVKNQYCTPFHYVRWDDGALYRILDTAQSSGGEALITYQCEHVIATLIDDVIFQSFQLDNWTTRQVIERVLSMQTAANWTLGECDFTRYFSYAWSNENLLAALFSVPNRFDTPYKWEYETSVYPWKLHLRVLDTEATPEYYIRDGKNLLASTRNNKGRDICTRLYALGYGEGINQLTFAALNDGKPYLDAPQEAIDKYGLITRIWEDARFERADNLLERAQVLLGKMSQPYEAYTVEAADIYKLTGEDLDRAAAGKIVSWDGYKTYILRVERSLDGEGVDRMEIANQPEDIAGSVAELADRQRINSVYAQGATCLYSQSFADNADAGHPLLIDLYIPQEARVINKVNLTWRIEAFRAYETGAAYGGGSTQTSQSGGGATTSAGGAQTVVTDQKTSGASSSTTTASKSLGTAGTGPDVWMGRNNLETGPGGEDGHTHATPMHRHAYDNSSHTHDMPHTHMIPAINVNIPAHTHNAPPHVHDVQIPSHNHAMVYGIYEGPRASTASLRVDGVSVPLALGQAEKEIAALLGVDGSGEIRRGAWHRIELIPNGLTRISGSIISQLFIQSEGGGKY